MIRVFSNCIHSSCIMGNIHSTYMMVKKQQSKTFNYYFLIHKRIRKYLYSFIYFLSDLNLNFFFFFFSALFTFPFLFSFYECCLSNRESALFHSYCRWIERFSIFILMWNAVSLRGILRKTVKPNLFDLITLFDFIKISESWLVLQTGLWTIALK